MDTRIALFQKKKIRKTIHADESWFVAWAFLRNLRLLRETLTQ